MGVTYEDPDISFRKEKIGLNECHSRNQR